MITVEEFIEETRQTMPRGFWEDASPEQLRFYIELVLSDINLFPPLTGYTLDNINQIPKTLLPVIKLGANLFAQLFWQMKASLQDFSYNDNGLTVTVDQVGKISQSYRTMFEKYKETIVNFKKIEKAALLRKGKALTTPRYQSQLGQALKVALGSAFTWNSV